MCRALAILATCACLCPTATPASAVPFLSVTADHLGGGVIQYTLTGNNDLGGAVAVQVTAVGNIVQALSTFANPEAGAPDGGVDLKSQADFADSIGTVLGLSLETYNAFDGNGGLDPGGNGGSVWDSWYDDTGVLTTSNPPFNSILVDGIVGGNIGSNQFSFSAGSPAASGASFRIGQIVILDPAAAVLPLGPTFVSTAGGLAQMDIIDVFQVNNPAFGAPPGIGVPGPDPGGPGLPGFSLIAAWGLEFSITGSFFASLPGDGNSDNAVDAADYTIWANNFGMMGVGIPGDYNNNGIVDAADYTVWANNFGLMIAGAGPSAVPEPTSFMLAGFGLIGLLAYRWRRRRRA